jgi:hypothetical protein
MNVIEPLKLCVPVVSAIVERVGETETEMLIQTRWKP